MSVEMYCGGRLVVLSSHATAYEVARAMENNHVGAVVVQERGRLLGIATDRDLALRVVARDLVPSEVRVTEVMTHGPATVDIGADEAQALAIMRLLHMRRLVILDGEHLAGIVTLDDLLMSNRIGVDEARDVVFGQLTDPSRGKPGGYVKPVRRYREPGRVENRRRARREQTLRAFARRLMELTGLHDRDQALVAFEVVASGLARRLTPDEARDFAAQLPTDLRRYLEGQSHGPDRDVTRETLIEELSHRLDVDEERAAELVSRTARALGHFVSPGELSDVLGQLPGELRELFDR